MAELQGRSQQGLPLTLATHRRGLRFGSCHAQRKRACGLGLGQRTVGHRQRSRGVAAQRQLGATDRQVGLAVDRGQRGAQGLQQRSGAFFGHARRRQEQREVGTVQTTGQRALNMPRIGLQHLRQRGQQPVGGVMADAPVHRVKMAQPHQQQAGTAVILGAQRAAQLRHEVTALRQPGDGVRMGLLAHLLQAGRLLLEHGLQPLHQRVHAARQPAQFGHARLVGNDEAPLLKRLRLRDRGIQRPAPGAHRQGRDHGRRRTQCRQPAGHLQDTAPQGVHGPVGMAPQLEATDRPPAVGHLGLAGLRVHRQQLRKPARRRARTFGQLALEDQAAVLAQQLQPPVMPGIELRRRHQLHARHVALLLRKGQRQHHGPVVVAHLQLLVQRLPRHQRVRGHAAQQRKQQHAKKHEPDLTDQGHHLP